jgi:hypothetical protein
MVEGASLVCAKVRLASAFAGTKMDQPVFLYVRGAPLVCTLLEMSCSLFYVGNVSFLFYGEGSIPYLC